MSDSVADMCTSYREELSPLQPTDPCGVCGVKVGRHARDPTVVAAAQASAAKASAAAVADPADPSVGAGNTSLFTKLMKISTQLPKWNKQTVCRTFLEKVSLIMPNSGVPSEKWNLVFRHLLSDDISALRWVTANVIDKALDWEASRVAFTTHFQSSDHGETLKMEYQACKQGRQESVQSYSDRFTNLLEQLGFVEDDPQTIMQFTGNLHTDIQIEFKRSVMQSRQTAPTFAIDTLHKAIQLGIEIDVINRTNELTVREPAQKSGSTGAKPGSSSGVSSGGVKHCKNHPNSTNHTTAECKMGASSSKAGAAGTPGANSGQFKQAPKGDRSSVECFNCGELGHYKTSCPNPKKNSNASSSGSRHSERQSNPPSRLTYEQKGQPTEQTSYASAAATPAARAVSLVKSDAAAFDPSATALDRTLPAAVLAPTETKRYVLFIVGGEPYKALVDQGADISIIDADLVKKLGLEVSAVSGELEQVSSAAPAVRMGITAPLRVACVTSMPQVSFPSKDFTHRFEVLPLSGEYQFILGADRMLDLIPVELVGQFVPRSKFVSASAAVRAVSAAAAAVSIEPAPSAVENLALAGVRLAEQNDGRAAIVDLDEDHRTSVSTPAELEAKYAPERDRIMADSDIVAALQRNSQVTGFCNLPETVVHLEVNPAMKQTLYRKQYKVAQIHHAGVDEVIQRWLDTGKIDRAPPGCEYNNPLLVVPKKDDNGQLTGIRVCLDVRALNKALLNNDKYQLPKIRDELETFGENSIFGGFDLKEAYLQFMVAEESRKYTAFTWRGTQYVFVGAPFGLSLLPSHFQRAASYIVSDMPFTFAYLDNIPFGSKTWREHKDHALTIIDRLTQCNLLIKPSSVILGHAQMKCLGHLLTNAGVAPDPDKQAKVKDWPLPRTGLEMMSFLGFAQYIAEHVRHFAELTSSLHAVKNDKVIIWTDEMKYSFQLTKEAIQRVPLLQFPDYSRPFYIATDASNTGIGGVLYQPGSDDNEDITGNNIVAMFSKKLSSAQRNYAAYKKELWAIVSCLRQFHSYVWGRNDLVVSPTVVVMHNILPIILYCLSPYGCIPYCFSILLSTLGSSAIFLVSVRALCMPAHSSYILHCQLC